MPGGRARNAGLAQDSGWSFALSPYAWTPGLTSSVDTAWGNG